uniref:Uncharacterized protein n=1 Tax=Utricularia reniformis TaxID=192314 RepID=A0A1Y0B219_9LAMI|nr:hypothetical protein AEK19_MT1199 [Utricularia reniformis]ART31413.1 hypothetical protein AEK19_MT1199 [Utricularia reniformis]
MMRISVVVFFVKRARLLAMGGKKSGYVGFFHRCCGNEGIDPCSKSEFNEGFCGGFICDSEQR